MRTLHWTLLLCLALTLGCPPAPPSQEEQRSGGSGEQADGDNADSDGERKTLRIAVIPKGTTHEFWKSVHAGAQQAADELGNVEVLWKGPVKEDDLDGQINVVQNFITKQVDAICLAPLDKQGLIDYVVEAKEADIPVVIFDSGLDGPQENYVTYVATDNENGGVLAAQEMIKVLGGKGDVIMLRYTPGSESTELRESGFLKTMQAEEGINLLSTDEYAGTTPEGAYAKALQVLAKYQDDVDGVFAVCEPNGNAVLQALKELGIADKVVFIGFDPNPSLVKGLDDDSVDGIVLQDPVTMGYEAVTAAVRHLRGEEVKPRIQTGEAVATPKNKDDERMSELLSPEQYEE